MAGTSSIRLNYKIRVLLKTSSTDRLSNKNSHRLSLLLDSMGTRLQILEEMKSRWLNYHHINVKQLSSKKITMPNR